MITKLIGRVAILLLLLATPANALDGFSSEPSSVFALGLFSGALLLILLLAAAAINGNIESSVDWIKSKKNIIGWAILSLIVISLGLFILWISLAPSESYRNENIKIMLQAGGGLIILFGLFLTYRRIKASEDQVKISQKQVEGLQDQIRVTEDGQITERFTRAVDQLGNRATEIQLGGIYALERISQESDRDYWPIMEILTGYIRHKTPVIFKDPETKEIINYLENPELAPPITINVQAALTVIARRKYEYGNFEKGHIDLSGTNLRHAQLSSVKLQHAFLIHTNLMEANLWEANLENALCFSACFKEAILNDSDLGGADFTQSDASGASMIGADFKNTKFNETKLDFVNFSLSSNLEIDQLSKAKTIYLSDLPGDLYAQIEERFPDLVKPTVELNLEER